MLQQIFSEYKSIGLKVIPIEWDVANKQPVSHHNWSEDKEWKLQSNHNAIMIHTRDCFAAIDVDIKNGIFHFEDQQTK